MARNPSSNLGGSYESARQFGRKCMRMRHRRLGRGGRENTQRPGWRALLQFANLDVSEPAVVLVIREHDRGLDVFAEAGIVLEFALRDARFHLGAVELALEH